MKKVSLLLAFAVISFSSFAQYNKAIATKMNAPQHQLSKASLEKEINKAPVTRSMNAEGDTLLYVDFDGAVLPTGWTVADNSGIGTWQVVTEGHENDMSQDWGVDNNYFSTGDFFSRANGFVELPIRFYNCTDDGSGNLTFVGDDYGEGAIEIDATLETDWLDLSGSASGGVNLVFNSFFLLWNTPSFEVHVTTDGNNWTTFNAMIIDGVTYGVNEWSPNNAGLPGYCTKHVFNITSAIADDPTHVKVLFKVFGTKGYSVAMDDIRFIEPAAVNDVNLTAQYAVMGGVYTLSETYSDGSAVPIDDYNAIYSEVPANLTHEFQLGAKIHQSEFNGENVRVNFTVDSAGVPNTYNMTSNVIPSFGAVVAEDTVLTSDYLYFYDPSLTQADFVTDNMLQDGYPFFINYEAISDNDDIDPTNNTADLETATTFGRMSYHWQPTENELVDTDGDIGIDSYSGLTGAVNDMFVNTFDAYVEDGDEFKFYGLRFFFPNENSAVFNNGSGVDIVPVIYFYDPTGGADGTGDYVSMADINDLAIPYTLTPEDTAKWVYLPFDELAVQTATFPTNTTYFIGIKVVNWNSSNFSIGVDKDYNQGDVHFKMNVDPYQGTWYYWGPGGSVMIDAYTQLNQYSYDMGVSQGIEENVYTPSQNVKVYPNPTTGIVKVENAENATISVYTLTGSLVKTIESNAVNTSFDLTGLAKGTYLVKVIKENEVVTKKINLLK